MPANDTAHTPDSPVLTGSAHPMVAAIDLAPPQQPNVLAQLTHPLIVAIDGGAGSGKSSVAKMVADGIGGAPVLDSGRWFRALGLIALRQSVDPTNAEQITALGSRFSFFSAPSGSPDELIARDASSSGAPPIGMPTEDLEAQQVAEYASIISRHPGLRAIFQDRQLLEAHNGCITVGRAQGSEVFPQEFSERTSQPVLRILLHANLETRALRRFQQHHTRPPSAAELRQVLRDLEERDDRDTNRSIAPLLTPDKAIQMGYIAIDTSSLSRDEVAQLIIKHIREIAPELSTKTSS